MWGASGLIIAGRASGGNRAGGAASAALCLDQAATAAFGKYQPRLQPPAELRQRPAMQPSSAASCLDQAATAAFGKCQPRLQPPAE